MYHNSAQYRRGYNHLERTSKDIPAGEPKQAYQFASRRWDLAQCLYLASSGQRYPTSDPWEASSPYRPTERADRRVIQLTPQTQAHLFPSVDGTLVAGWPAKRQGEMNGLSADGSCCAAETPFLPAVEKGMGLYNC